MTLEFHKLTRQIEEFSAYVAGKQEDSSRRMDLALRIWQEFSSQEALTSIHQRVDDVIRRDLGYRGASPLDEPIMSSYPPAPLPSYATLIAADGSQIAPDPHGPMLYYLLNIGAIRYRVGSGITPDIISQPWLYYDDGSLFLDQGLISAEMVDNRRTMAELAVLADIVEESRECERPIIALVDGPLLFILKRGDPEREQLRAVYFDSMKRTHAVNASLVGYTDRPRSSFIMALLHIISLSADKINEKALTSNGALEGLHDIQVLKRFLPPGHRSALFVQMSPMNKEFRNTGGDALEIAFFYLNVSNNEGRPIIVRIELPMWVASQRNHVAEIQALLIQQCHLSGLRYPYILTRADELAVVKRDEARQLETMLQTALTRQEIASAPSEKQSGKNAARAAKTRLR